MSAPDFATSDLLRELKAQLDATPHGAKSALVKSAANRLGVKPVTVHRWLRDKAERVTGRKPRKDKGDSRLPSEKAQFLAAMLAQGGRRNGKQVTTLKTALSIAKANGEVDLSVSLSTAERILREAELLPRQLSKAAPHTRLRSLHPNHVWQIDPSLCVVYYEGGRVRILDTASKFYKNNTTYVEKMNPLRVWRYVQTDHTSAALYGRYYALKGESSESVFEFLMDAMAPRDPRHIMRGVPWQLVWDAGSANKSHAVQHMLTALQVRHWAHTPGNPRAKGQVEQGNNLVELDFEGRLPFCAVPSVEELNSHLDEWLVAKNSEPFYRDGKLLGSRYGLWQMIRAEQLRFRPERAQCELLLTSKPERRIVRGDLTISFAVKNHGSARYSVEHVEGISNGDAVDVVVSAYHAPNICIVRKDAEGRIRYFECKPQDVDSFGFPVDAPVIGERYAARADTPADTKRKDMAEIAYGTRDLTEARKAKDKGVIPFGGTLDPWKDVREAAAQAPSHLVRRGTELHLPNPVQIEVRPLSLVEALRNLRDWLGRPISPAEREQITQWYPQGVPETELQDIVNRLSQPVQEERPRLALVR